MNKFAVVAPTGGQLSAALVGAEFRPIDSLPHRNSN